MLSFIKKYNIYFDKFLKEYQNSEMPTYEAWRNIFFINFLKVVSPLSVLTFLFNLPTLIVRHEFEVVIGDLIAIGVIFYGFMVKKGDIQFKKIVFIFGVYIMSITLLFYLGFAGPGLLYLFCLSILIILIHSNRLAYISLLINFFLSFLPFLGSYLGYNLYDDMTYFSMLGRIAFTTNFWFLNSIIIISLGVTLNLLSQKINQEALLHKDLTDAKYKAEESDRLKSAFLANLSHELRTPMNSIVGFTSLLNSEISDEEREIFHNMIKKNTNDLLALIDNVVEYSKIEAGHYKIDLSKINMHFFLLEIFNEIKKLVPNNLEFFLKLSDCRDLIIESDAAKLQSILKQLLLNSIKFTERGYIELGCKRENAKFVIYVKDTGIGIKKEDLEIIFERFYQGNDFAIGTGLGLTIAKELSDLISINLKVESDFGKGTIFKLIF